MRNLIIIVLIFCLISLFLSYISFISDKNVIDIVNDMGIGYNLGNVFIFNCCKNYENFEEINNQIEYFYSILPTKKIVNKIKKYGFKTIRLELNCTNLNEGMEKNTLGRMTKLKEIVNWIIKTNLYCILSVRFNQEFWKSEGKNAKDKYINIWKQIANNLIDYNEYLIFESNNNVYYEKNFYDIDIDINNDNYYDSDYPSDENDNNYDYNDDFDYNYYKYDVTLLDSNQIFIDTIRNTGGFNTQRLLIISGLTTELELSNNLNYQMPIDPSNKFAISLHYYFPSEFTDFDYEGILFESYNYNGDIYEYAPINKWGSINNYKKLVKNFDLLKMNFIDNGIPVIIAEVGINFGQENEIISIREFLYAFFSISLEYKGIMSCLWDISDKIGESINYYNRESDSWNDKKIINSLMKFFKGNYIKLSEFNYLTNLETEDTLHYDNFEINFTSLKPLKIIINLRLFGYFGLQLSFGFYSEDKNNEFFDIIVQKENGKKQYDGTTIFTIDVSDKDCHNYIRSYINWGRENIIFNNLTIEFEESFFSIDYNSYKSSILKEIN